jgi:hypothetical protein
MRSKIEAELQLAVGLFYIAFLERLPHENVIKRTSEQPVRRGAR